MNKIKMFLAGSLLLQDERRAMIDLVNEKNYEWYKKNIYIELKTSRDFDESKTDDRTQDHYNDYIRECDIVVVLVAEKLGRYTLEEYKEACASGNKPKIFVYFKICDKRDVVVERMLQEYEKPQQYPNLYAIPKELSDRFNHQLTLLQKNRVIRPGISRIVTILFCLIIGVSIGGISIKYFSPQMLFVKVHDALRNELEFEGGSLSLEDDRGINSINIQKIEDELVFKDIKVKYPWNKIRLRFSARGYYMLDTLVRLCGTIELPIYRDDTYGVVFGTIRDVFGQVVEGATVHMENIVTTSDHNGKFLIHIPIEKQRKSQRLTINKKGYKQWDNLGAPSNTREWKIILQKK